MESYYFIQAVKTKLELPSDNQAAAKIGITRSAVSNHLDIQPQHIRLSREPARIMEANRQLWYKGAQHQPLGLAAPVKKLLDSLLQNDLFTD